jgi:WhiB family redox-sensing transcriptional regulator
MTEYAPTTGTGTGDWRHAAGCSDTDGELFFPAGTTGPYLLQIEEAKAICRRCPVMEQCLQWALNNRIEYGVWGGMSEDERRLIHLRTRRNQRRARTQANYNPEERARLARDLAERHQAGVSINALAIAIGRSWDLARELVDEGLAAA